jgi:hypothetical protein
VSHARDGSTMALGTSLALATCKLLEQLGRSVSGNLVLTLDKGRELHARRMRTAVLHKREVNPTRGALCAILLAFGSLGTMEAQEAPIPQLTPGSARKPAPASSAPSTSAAPQSVALFVPTGTPLQVALDQEIRVKNVGQPIHGRIIEAVYAFDRIVIPIGSEVIGRVTRIGAISGGLRARAALDADFTPERKVENTYKITNISTATDVAGIVDTNLLIIAQGLAKGVQLENPARSAAAVTPIFACFCRRTGSSTQAKASSGS